MKKKFAKTNNNVQFRGGVTIKALSIAALAGCAIIGCAQGAFAASAVATDTSSPLTVDGGVNTAQILRHSGLDPESINAGLLTNQNGQTLNLVQGDTTIVPALDGRGSEGAGVNTAQNELPRLTAHNDAVSVTPRTSLRTNVKQSTNQPTGFAADIYMGTEGANSLFKDKPVMAPTLDYMHSQGVAIKNLPPSEGSVYYFKVNIVDDDGNVILSVYGFDGMTAEEYKQLQENKTVYDLVDVTSEYVIEDYYISDFVADEGYSSLEEMLAAENCTTLREYLEKTDDYSFFADPVPQYEEYMTSLQKTPITDYQSAYTVSDGDADSADIEYKTADKNGNLTSKYVNITYRTPEMLAKNPNIEWSKSDSGLDVPVSLNNSEGYDFEYKNINNYQEATETLFPGSGESVTNVLFKGFLISRNGGAIYVSRDIGDIKADFVNNTSSGYQGGGAIFNSASINSITGDFVGNSAQRGGAIYNEYRSTINSITGDFVANIGQYGAAIYNNSYATIGSITGNFIGNIARQSAYPAAESRVVVETNYSILENRGNIGSINGNFIANSSDYVIRNYYYNPPTRDASGPSLGNVMGKIGSITGSFVGNNCDVVIYNGGDYSPAVIGDINADFINNRGGAIHNDYRSTINSITGDFIRNQGGIYNNHGEIGDITGNFIYNEYGAIINYNGKLGTIRGNFLYNNAGAIYDEAEIGRKSLSSDLNIKDSYFFRNDASIYNSDSAGGAVATGINQVRASLASLRQSRFNIQSSDFIENRAKYGGAVAFGYDVSASVDNSFDVGSLSSSQSPLSAAIQKISGTIENSNFINNEAYLGGAIAVSGAVAVYKERPPQAMALNDEGYTVYDNSGSSNDTNVLVIKNSNFIGNTAYYNRPQAGMLSSERDGDGDNSLYVDFYENPKGGAIITDDNIKITADGGNSIFKGNKVIDSDGNVTNNDVFVVTATGDCGLFGYNQAMGRKEPELTTLTLDARNGGTLSFDGTIDGGIYQQAADASLDDEEEQPESAYNLDITGDGTGQVVFGNSVINANITTYKDSVSVLANDVNWNNNIVSLNGGTLSMSNGAVGIADFNRLLVANDTNLIADVDLKTQQMDRITAKEYGEHMGNLKVVGMNLLSDAPEGRDKTEIFFAETGLKDNVTNGTGELPDKNQTVAYTPIYKYNVSYDNRNDGGYFVFNRGALINGGGGNSGNPSDNFNPAVLSVPTANVAATQATVNETFKYVFEHADAFTQMPSHVRHASLNANKYAISTDFNNNLGELYKNNSAGWFRPYVTFEKMDLKHGPKVDAITYGSLAGFDTDFHEHKRGWHSVGTGYIGYNGNQLHYHGVDTTMNGGLLGYTHTMYKNNFWTALTLSAGASVGESRTMYGKEDFTSLMAGVGSKTGYNFEFKEGKYILQPIMFMSYTFANTFDYTNAAGVKIKPSPAHSIQLNPSVRFIANTKNGWQPYASVGMVWNVMNENKVTANSVRLPEMGMKPYVEYGLGIQRNWKDRFTAFGQAMIRNGGRTGIALTGGFRWALGKEGKGVNEKVNNETLKQVQGDTKLIPAPCGRGSEGEGVNATQIHNQTDRLRVGARSDAGNTTKTVLKQLSPAQKTALGKHQNTTRTTSSAVLKAL